MKSRIVVAALAVGAASGYSLASSFHGRAQLNAVATHAAAIKTCTPTMALWGSKPAVKPSAPTAANGSTSSSSGSRPTAGATKKGGQKTKVTTDAQWTGPAVERRAKSQAIAAKKAAEKAAKGGTFSPQQYEAFLDARQIVPSNAPNYWQKVAELVPGQSAENCKKMANQVLFDKAAGTKKDFFKSYVEVIEVKDVVDEDADVMKKLGNLFSFGRKK